MTLLKLPTAMVLRRHHPWTAVLLACVLVAGVAGDLSSDGQVLLAFKSGLEDLEGSLQSWNSSVSPCSWAGVECTAAGDGVRSLTINSTNITGPLDGRLCAIGSLELLLLETTDFNGTFPEGLFGCSNLTSLTISQTSVGGSLPDGFGALRGLVNLDLGGNLFEGSLPASIGDLPRLQLLDLSGNLFQTGGIPSSYGKLSSLQMLDICCNGLAGPFLADLSNLTQLQHLEAQQNLLSGSIPESIGLLSQLTYLDLTNNSFTGPIPEAIGNLTSLVYAYLGINQLSATIPQAITRLASLQYLYLYNNSLTGPFPPGMEKLVNMTQFLVQANQLSGDFPHEWAQWRMLQRLDIDTNQITGTIPAEFGDLPKLTDLSVFMNKLTGTLPWNLGANSPMTRVEAGFNSFSGPMPPHLCAVGKVHTIAVQSNSLSGDFPSTYDQCTSLTGISTANNFITGNFPKNILASPNLIYVDISANNFSGSLPPELGTAINLQTLRIFDNQFSGPLPEELGWMTGLVVLIASGNSLEGPIPSSVGNLVKLQQLYLDFNRLSGSIPPEIGGCVVLSTLNATNNHMSGPIPATLAALPNLVVLDLSDNSLTGAIPDGFGSLTSFNFSNNKLSGLLPPAYRSGLYADNFEGNPGLCGDGLQSVSVPCGQRRREKWPWIMAGTFAVAVLLLVVGCCCFWQKFARHWRVQEREDWVFRSFQQVDFGADELVSSLEEGDVIGWGGAGKVYKVLLPSGQAVAVKRLLRPARARDTKYGDLGFEAEVETLGKNTRHRNIVKLLCCCSNIDSNLLVYEYLRRGNLWQALHGQQQQVVLDWPARHRIAFGSASALDYLHHECVPQILHRDIKANNILLDDNLEARVSDFGLAKVLDPYSTADDIVTGLAGSHGYIAPEYGYTFKITEKSDIYSFGVVLLELVTGRQPIDSKVYGEDSSLTSWVSGVWHQREQLVQYHHADRDAEDLVRILVDDRLGLDNDEDRESILQVLQLGLLCTQPAPLQRPSARVVVEILQQCGPQRSAKNSKPPSRQTSKHRPEV